jgi:hypothetical protein
MAVPIVQDRQLLVQFFLFRRKAENRVAEARRMIAVRIAVAAVMTF